MTACFCRTDTCCCAFFEARAEKVDSWVTDIMRCRVCCCLQDSDGDLALGPGPFAAALEFATGKTAQAREQSQLLAFVRSPRISWSANLATGSWRIQMHCMAWHALC